MYPVTEPKAGVKFLSKSGSKSESDFWRKHYRNKQIRQVGNVFIPFTLRIEIAWYYGHDIWTVTENAIYAESIYIRFLESVLLGFCSYHVHQFRIFGESGERRNAVVQSVMESFGAPSSVELAMGQWVNVLL